LLGQQNSVPLRKIVRWLDTTIVLGGRACPRKREHGTRIKCAAGRKPRRAITDQSPSARRDKKEKGPGALRGLSQE